MVDFSDTCTSTTKSGHCDIHITEKMQWESIVFC